MSAARARVVRGQRVDEVLRDVVARAVGKPLRGEELERGGPPVAPVREPPEVEEDEAVERVEDDGRGLVDGDDERAPLLDLQRPEVADDLLGHRGVQPAGGLVEEHAPRGAEERARHGCALHLPAAHAADQPVAHVGVGAPAEVELRDDLGHLGAFLLHRIPGRELGHGGEEDRLRDGGAAEEAVLLLDVRGVLLDHALGGHRAVEVVLAGEFALGLAAADDVEEGGLAGAAGAHDGAHVARVDRPGDLRADGMWFGGRQVRLGVRRGDEGTRVVERAHVREQRFELLAAAAAFAGNLVDGGQGGGALGVSIVAALASGDEASEAVKGDLDAVAHARPLPGAHFLVRERPVRGHAGQPSHGRQRGIDVDADIHGRRRVLAHVAGTDRRRCRVWWSGREGQRARWTVVSVGESPRVLGWRTLGEGHLGQREADTSSDPRLDLNSQPLDIRRRAV